jgi:hypothetical protein
MALLAESEGSFVGSFRAGNLLVVIKRSVNIPHVTILGPNTRRGDAKLPCS